MRKLLSTILLLAQFIVFGQKEYAAQRIDAAVYIDGLLDEPIWKDNQTGGFIQFEPNVGESASFDTDVYVRYDDEALYVGLMAFDPQPDKILKELSNRDETSNTDAIGFCLDTYRDGINAFCFTVTAAGVQRDSKYSSEGEDQSWDGVWESGIAIHRKGWSAEFKVPYYTIRFAELPEQKWGFQVSRDIRRFRESNLWNPANPNIEGFVNQFGVLKGISDIKPPFRLSLTPYLSGYYNSAFIPGVAGSAEHSTAYSAGLDVKLGLSDAFTLDMTLIPDFGQTISDQQVLNLSPFEVFFEENRPFFTEGLELFNKGNLFYTRRVGSTPIRYYDVANQLLEGERIVSNPDMASLINATKVSGRTSKGTGIGLFNGITAIEHAVIENEDGYRRSVQTSPLTNYSVAVVDQTLKNNSFITLMNTNILRWGDDIDANCTGVYTALNDKNQIYGIRANADMTNRFTREENDFGYSYNLEAGKIGGLWTYTLSHGLESDRYNPNDLGFLLSPNEVYYSSNIAYNQYKPKNDKMNLYRYRGGFSYRTLFKPHSFTDMDIYFSNFWLYKSRDAFGYDLSTSIVSSRNYFEPRTFDFQTYLPVPRVIQGGAFFSSDYRKTLAIDCGFNIAFFDKKGRDNFQFNLDPRIRFSDKFSLFLSSDLQLFYKDQGYVSRYVTNKDGSIQDLLEGHASHILIGERNRQILTNQITLKYIFNKVMGVNMRVRHYWDKVIYNEFLTLDRQSNLTYNSIQGSSENNQPYFDTNLNFFNIDLQYQWRFAPGSDIFIVWKNSISARDTEFDVNYFGNLGNLWNNLQTNSISVRAVYFLDYQSII
jgi:hypothetical protein